MASASAQSPARRKARRNAILKALFCVLALALFFLFALTVGDADYHGTPVGWVPFFALLIGILLAWIYVRVAARGFRFSDAALQGACHRGDQAAFSMNFSNRTPLFLFRIEAFFYVADADGNVAGEASTTISLAPFESYDMSFRAVLDHVGCYEAGLDRVVLHDFVNLFSRTVRNERRSSICVTPKLVPIEQIHFSEDTPVESMDAAKATLADSMDYAYVRPYVAGDPLKTIHWKISARTEHLQTRLFEVYNNPGVTVLLDFYTPVEDVRERMELLDGVVESGLSVARYAMQEGMDVDIRWCDKHGERRVLYGWDDDAAPGFVRDLPMMSNEASERERTHDLLTRLVYQQEGQGNVVVCSANLGSDMIGSVMELAVARRAPLFVAVIPSRLVDREREEYCAPLSAFDGADLPSVAVSKAAELSGVKL